MSKSITHVLGVILISTLTLIFSILAPFFNVNLQKSPFVCVKESKILPKSDNKWWEEQVIELTHSGGDKIDVENIKIRVEIYRNGVLMKRCTLNEFPWKCDSTFIRSKIEGDVIIQTSPNNCTKFLGELHYKKDGIWDVGDKIGFRIKYESGGEGFDLKSRDVVRITLIYKSLNNVIYTKDLVVSQSNKLKISNF